MSGKYPKQMKGFYECVRKILYACRIAGFLPISGLLNAHSEFSRCTWSSYNIYYIISLILLVVGGVIKYNNNQHPGDHFREMGIFLKQCLAIVAAFFLLKFALNWKTMISKIKACERLLPPLNNSERASRNSKRIIILVVAVDCTEYLVHFLFNIRMFVLCSKEYEFTVKSYYMYKYKWLTNKMAFNYGIVFIIEFQKLQTLFIYHFVDILVLAVTLYLVNRLQNFNRLMLLRQLTCTKNNNTRWMDLQAHYTRLARLVKIIDDHVNPFIFLSFLSNLVFICKTIYVVIQKQKQLSRHIHDNEYSVAQCSDWVAVLDTFTNVMHLFIKSTLISGLTAHLHTLSRKPLDALHTVPASAYNLEMQRFMDQVYYSHINLTGFGIFKVTRGTILSMLSTIITYELVLLQLPMEHSNIL